MLLLLELLQQLLLLLLLLVVLPFLFLSLLLFVVVVVLLVGVWVGMLDQCMLKNIPCKHEGSSERLRLRDQVGLHRPLPCPIGGKCDPNPGARYGGYCMYRYSF